MSTEHALSTIAICQLITTIMVFLTAGALIAVIFLFKRMVSQKADELMSRVQPIVDDAKAVAEQAKETAEKVSEKVDSIMTKAEDTADKVTTRMDSVTAKVEEAVSPQAATVAGYAVAAMKAFQLFQQVAAVKQAAKPKEEEC